MCFIVLDVGDTKDDTAAADSNINDSARAAVDYLQIIGERILKKTI